VMESLGPGPLSLGERESTGSRRARQTFSEFRRYDVIGNPVMINAYGASPAMAGSSPKAQWWKDQWVQEKNCRSPYPVEVLDTPKLVPRR